MCGQCACNPHRKAFCAAQGETVPYVICVGVAEDGTRADGGGSKGVAERAYHVDEVRGNARLATDTEYYLAHQVRARVAPAACERSGRGVARKLPGGAPRGLLRCSSWKGRVRAV